MVVKHYQADIFPTTVLEALACNIPVVTSAVGGIPEQVGEGRNGFLVPVGDAPALARQVLDLLADEGGAGCRWGGRPRRTRRVGLGWRGWWRGILRFTGRTSKKKAYRLKSAIIYYALPNP